MVTVTMEISKAKFDKLLGDGITTVNRQEMRYDHTWAYDKETNPTFHKHLLALQNRVNGLEAEKVVANKEDGKRHGPMIFFNSERDSNIEVINSNEDISVISPPLGQLKWDETEYSRNW